MSLGTNPVKNGLVFGFDVGNHRYYPGEPTTNLLNSSTNTIPTTGNGWGTYNTNQYNGATYFSIGTISSISNNIVTTSSAHPLRSFDVVTPQTTGGGVTAGTNYLIKKLSSTTFSIHTYNSSQDGSQGYTNPSTGMFKVYDDYANDTRISINSSSFPTMWWGPPHLPNSGLVKEIITNGFTNPLTGEVSNCIRQHVHRADGVADHMAYGVDASFTPNVTITCSFWGRAVDDNAVGKSINYYHYTYGQTSATAYSMNATLGPKGVWQRFSYSFNSPNSVAISYWFNPGGPYKYDIANIQIEQKSHATNYIGGSSSRTNTTGLKDLKRTSTIDLTNASYDSSNFILLDGSSDGISISKSSIFYTNNWTWEFVVKWTSNTGTYQGIVWAEGATGSGDSGYQYLLALYNHTYFHYRITNTASGWANTNTSNITFTPSNYNHIVWQFNNGTTNIYVNGTLFHTETGTRGSYNGGSDSKMWVGCRNDLAYSSAASIPVVRHYQRQLTSSEISRNYQSYKRRFSLP